MTEEYEDVEQAEKTQTIDAPKPVKRRKPSIKDWIRVVKSTTNGQPNTVIELVINEATGICEIHTNAPVAEGSDELEGERVQVLRFTNYTVVNDGERDPVGAAPESANAE